METIGALLTAQDVADRLGIKLSTVRRKILLREVPTVKIGRSIRIPAEAIEDLIRRGYRPAKLATK